VIISSRIKLVIAAFLIAISITSCSAADDGLRGISKFFKILPEPPPPKPIPPVPVPANSQAAQRIRELIQQAGAGARSAKEVGKKAALRVPLTGNREIYEKNLREVAYETVLQEMQYYAGRFTREQLREMTEQLALEIVNEVASAQALPQPEQSTIINATIAGKPGSKNIRSGPGTTYDVIDTAYSGDRIVILGKNQDQGGYIWYKVQLQSSGNEGWIASHLVRRD
jgi:Bacterial SH3 domain